MIKEIHYFLILTVLMILTDKSEAQNFWHDYEGIPFVTYSPHDIGAYHYDSIKSMGIDVVIASNLTTQRLLEIKDRGLKVIPLQADTTLYDPNFNDILKYTDARYSIWEAEGTDKQIGDATLIYNRNLCEQYNVNNRVIGIITKKNAAKGNLISGPGYRQEAHYRGLHLNQLIQYRASFKLKLESIKTSKELNPKEVICVLQIINSTIKWSQIVDTKLIKERQVTINDLSFGEWKQINIDYDFSVINPSKAKSEFFPSLGWAEFVEFNIIWQGNPNYRLAVDKIIISDDRGREITNPKYHSRIWDQDRKSFPKDFENFIVDWQGIDEPESIDNYEPIRIVDSILTKSSNGKRRLWIAFPSSWNGKYGDSQLGAQPLYKWVEFIKRTKRSGIQNDHTIFDYPLTETVNPFGGDFREKNISIFTDSILSVIKNYDSSFALCLQGGRYDRASLFKDPKPSEILYTANLGLLYGAKAFSVYRYFGETDNPKHSGLVTYSTDIGYIYTDKYYFFCNILSPRLKGNFGKTIKQLSQINQFPKLNLAERSNVNLNFIKEIIPNKNKSNDTSVVDIGFFKNGRDESSKYFMVVNRYYSSVTDFTFTVQNLEPNSLYQVVNYIDNINESVFSNDKGELKFKNIIDPGDGRLYSIKKL